jgi:hypothetical protein
MRRTIGFLLGVLLLGARRGPLPRDDDDPQSTTTSPLCALAFVPLTCTL